MFFLFVYALFIFFLIWPWLTKVPRMRWSREKRREYVFDCKHKCTNKHVHTKHSMWTVDIAYRIWPHGPLFSTPLNEMEKEKKELPFSFGIKFAFDCSGSTGPVFSSSFFSWIVFIVIACTWKAPRPWLRRQQLQKKVYHQRTKRNKNRISDVNCFTGFSSHIRCTVGLLEK